MRSSSLIYYILLHIYNNIYIIIYIYIYNNIYNYIYIYYIIIYIYIDDDGDYDDGLLRRTVPAPLSVTLRSDTVGSMGSRSHQDLEARGMESSKHQVPQHVRRARNLDFSKELDREA